MGLTAANFQTQGTISTFGPLVMSSLQNAADRLLQPSSNAAARRWFGDDSAQFKLEMSKRLRKMRSVINVNSIVVGGEDWKQRDPDTNASAWPAAAPVGMGGTIRTNAGEGGVASDRRSVYLDGNFSHLPKFLPLVGGTIDASGDHQSQLNTLVHELSHLLIGTDDEDGPDGDTAYGTYAAEALAAFDAATAQNNAENWGIFVEACGYHNAS